MMKSDEKLLIATINDLFSLCDKHCEMKCSDFLDGGELAFIEDEVRIPYGYNVFSFGGYETAERKLFCVLPQWQEEEDADVPISVVRIDVPKHRTLSHRDYLGTVMSLGIDRCKIGDILTGDDGAYIFVMSDMAEYVERNVNKIANVGVKTHIIALSELVLPQKKTVEKTCVCASLRLDAVIASMLNVSRSIAEKAVSSGYVKVNHREVTDRSRSIKEDDLISVRGYGRYVLREVGNSTRKGRLHIVVEKFV